MAILSRNAQKRRRARIRHLLTDEVFWIVLVLCVGLGLVFWPRIMTLLSNSAFADTDKILFVGDVMLARSVEKHMEQHGAFYPFAGVRTLFDTHPTIVGNFEGSIPQTHVPTPSMSFRFSIKKEYADVLARVGFTHFSLANNHAYDFGASGHAHTKETLSLVGIATGGNPNAYTPEEIMYASLDGLTIVIIPLNTTYAPADREKLRVVIEAAEATSDMQIAYVHWGNEYEPLAAERERSLARFMVDEGVDAVIGHHPHVVQDVEIYRGAPLFYSLGNFVFDQYWEPAVRQGLAVSLSRNGTHLEYELIPVTSEAARSVPAPMERVARQAFLDDIAARGDFEDAGYIQNGKIRQLVASLATSSSQDTME